MAYTRETTELTMASSGLSQCGCGKVTLRWRDPLSVLLINPLLLWLAVRRHDITIVHARSRCLALVLMPGVNSHTQHTTWALLVYPGSIAN